MYFWGAKKSPRSRARIESTSPAARKPSTARPRSSTASRVVGARARPGASNSKTIPGPASGRSRQVAYSPALTLSAGCPRLTACSPKRMSLPGARATISAGTAR